MSVVRGTSLTNYPRLVAELGGIQCACFARQAFRPHDVGEYDVFIPFRGVLQAIESAAEATATPDFGRRLAERQGIEILGPVGGGCTHTATVTDAFAEPTAGFHHTRNRSERLSASCCPPGRRWR